MSSRLRILGTSYLGVQAAGIVGWWCLLALAPESRPLFKAPDAADTALLAFWLPDLLVAVVGSGVSAVLVWRRSEHGSFALAVTAGAMLYAALYCIALFFFAPGTWLAALLMLPAAVTTTVLAWLCRCRSDR